MSCHLLLIISNKNYNLTFHSLPSFLLYPSITFRSLPYISFSRQRKTKTKQKRNENFNSFTDYNYVSVCLSLFLFSHTLSLAKFEKKHSCVFFLSLLVWVFTLFLFFIVRLWANILCLCLFAYSSPQCDYFSVCCNFFCPDFSCS
jgi:hypothetical protein